MVIIAFKGATAYEFQIGRLVIKILRYNVWCRRNIRRWIKIDLICS